VAALDACFVQELDSVDSMQVDSNTVDDIPASESDDSFVDDISDESEATTDDAAAAADYVYMPVKRIVSDKEQLKQQALMCGEESPAPVVHVKTVPSTVYSIPLHLTAYAHDLGYIDTFPSPKKDDTHKLGRMAASR